MTRFHSGILSALAAMMLILTSCRQELCYDHFPTLHVDLSWETAWERDYGQYHLEDWDAEYHGMQYTDLMPGIPEWVNLITYYDNNEYREHYMSPEGEKMQVVENKKSSMLLYNGDTEYIVLSDVASANNARATATNRSRATLTHMMERYPASRLTNPPDVLYAAYIDNVDPVSNHEVRHMPIKMQPLVYTYIIIYEFDYGLKYATIARGALGGMAESVYLRTGTTSEESSIILFDCGFKSYGCRAEVRSFGVPGFPDEYYGRTAADAKPREYNLNLEVMLRNGKVVEFNIDVTDQVKAQPRGGVIKVTGLRIEDEQAQGGTSGGGFDVDVDNWDDNETYEILFGNQTK